MLVLSLALGLLTRLLTDNKSSSPSNTVHITTYTVEEVVEVVDLALIIDVRSNSFYEQGHIAGAVNLPHDQFFSLPANFETTLERASRSGKAIILYCAGTHCDDAEKACQMLSQKGMKVGVYTGGWEEWSQLGFPTEP